MSNDTPPNNFFWTSYEAMEKAVFEHMDQGMYVLGEILDLNEGNVPLGDLLAHYYAELLQVETKISENMKPQEA
jgi:hypothetical protein